VLDELTVKGFGIIEEIDWRPGEGLNVITGETGAGKSLVVDAVEALLTGQINEEDIRHGSDEARVEGVFRITPGEKGAQLRELLQEKGLAANDDALLLACDFRRQGRTTPRVNRQAVSRALLRDIGAALVDIHGQSQHLSLLKKENHREFLDAYARTGALRHDFGEMVTELHQIEREIASLSRSEHELARQTELLKFQIEEIKGAELWEEEEDELEREITLLTSAEALKTAAYEIFRAIYGDEDAMDTVPALDKIGEAVPVMRQIVEADPSQRPKLGYLEEVVHGLEELAREIRAYGDNLNFDPQRLEEVQGRRELIRGLKRKYGGSVVEVLDYLARAEKELDGIIYSDERRGQLEEDQKQLKKKMGSLAEHLSQDRRQAARKLAAAIKKELGDLSLAQVEFDVSITQEASQDGVPFVGGTCYRFDSSGTDDVVFVAATNPGEPMKPLDRIASTGEISRFMLALKSALAGADTIPLLIFDEIDIGVGGRSGEVIGRKLWALSRNHQVICITHLPQIAAFADTHFTVSKHTAGDRTVSTITVLEGETRQSELAAMVAGPRVTATARNTAGELIEKAEAWKQQPELKM
jgi:DNA repair protein RecN (Recombination protein N)